MTTDAYGRATDCTGPVPVFAPPDQPEYAAISSAIEPGAAVVEVHDCYGMVWQRTAVSAVPGGPAEPAWTDEAHTVALGWQVLLLERGPLTWDGMPPVDLSKISRSRAKSLPVGTRVIDSGIVGTLVRCSDCDGDGTLVQPDQQPPAEAVAEKLPAVDLDELRRQVECAIGLHSLTTDGQTKPLAGAVMEVVRPLVSQLDALVRGQHHALTMARTAIGAADAARSAAVAHLESRTELGELADEDCTGVAATWCPIHGDCACPERAPGDHPQCPLHSASSTHAYGLADEAAS